MTLNEVGYFYGSEKLAIAATRRQDPKVCLGWGRTPRLSDPEHGSGLLQLLNAVAVNPAVVTKNSTLVIVEADSRQDLEYLRVGANLPTDTVAVVSSPGRYHLWYRPPAGLTPSKWAFRCERAKLTADANRYFLVPPAIHPRGHRYRFAPAHGPERGIRRLSECEWEALTRLFVKLSAAQNELSPSSLIGLGSPSVHPRTGLGSLSWTEDLEQGWDKDVDRVRVVLMHYCGIQPELGESFPCPLHLDRSHKAALYRSPETGTYFLQCHSEKRGQSHTLAWAIAQMCGWPAGTDGPTNSVYQRRILVESGILEPADIPEPPENLPRLTKAEQRVYAGFTHLLRVRWTREPGVPTTFARSFAAPGAE